MPDKILKMTIALLIFIGGMLFWFLLEGGLKNSLYIYDDRNIVDLLIIMSIIFISFGFYSLFSRKTWGRSWQKYWGGWINKKENPYYYWSYTIMYLVAGVLILFGCFLLQIFMNR